MDHDPFNEALLIIALVEASFAITLITKASCYLFKLSLVSSGAIIAP